MGIRPIVIFTEVKENGICEEVDTFEIYNLVSIPRIGETVSGFEKPRTYIVTNVIHRVGSFVVEVILKEK